MTRNRLPITMLLLLLGLLVTACAFSPQTIQASQNYVTETRAVPSFNAVTVGGNAHVEIVRNGTESLTVTVADNVLPHLQIEVQNGRLYVQPKPNVQIENDHGYTVTLTVKDLSSLNLAGNSNALVNGIETSEWTSELSGNSYAALNGSAAKQSVVVDGNSFYDAANLTSAQATVRADGNSHAALRVSDKLDATVKGLAVVEYIGMPLVEQNVENLAALKQRAPR
jgi:hypothetical protein